MNARERALRYENPIFCGNGSFLRFGSSDSVRSGVGFGLIRVRIRSDPGTDSVRFGPVFGQIRARIRTSLGPNSVRSGPEVGFDPGQNSVRSGSECGQIRVRDRSFTGPVLNSSDQNVNPF